MPITDIPILSMLRTKMEWHQVRQRMLAENVANSDTPGFRPADLAQPEFDDNKAPVGGIGLTRTSSSHLSGTGDASASKFRLDNKAKYALRPGGNGVSVEDEMMKVANNQMDYQAATALYTRSLGLIKTALGKR